VLRDVLEAAQHASDDPGAGPARSVTALAGV